jgi:azurin
MGGGVFNVNVIMTAVTRTRMFRIRLAILHKGENPSTNHTIILTLVKGFSLSFIRGMSNSYTFPYINKYGTSLSSVTNLTGGGNIDSLTWISSVFYINPVRTSRETHYFTDTKPNRLMLSEETIAVYCENHTEHTDTLCGQNALTGWAL